MVQFFKSKKKKNIVLILLLIACFIQSLIIARLYTGKDDKLYEVNLVKINNEKDSIDHLQLKTDLALVDQSIRSIDGFLKSKNVSDLRIDRLAQDSLQNEVYLAKVSNRYSQYLADLEQKLQQVPLGIPTYGYIYIRKIDGKSLCAVCSCLRLHIYTQHFFCIVIGGYIAS